MPNWKKVVVSGSDATLNSLNLTSTGSGQTVLDIQGSQGQLFSITDDLTGDIFSISDISGVPIFNINASGATTFDGYVPDNSKLKFGDSGDLEIYHDGSHSRIKDAGTGNLVINASSFVLNNSADSKNMIIATDGGATSLYCNGSLKLATTSTGVAVTGQAAFTGDVQLLTSTGEYSLYGTANGQTALYNNGVKKFETGTTGVTITGNANFSGFVLDGNTITGINDSGEFDDNDSHIMTSAGVNDRIDTRISGLTSNTGTVTNIISGNVNTLTKSGTTSVTLTPNVGAVSNGGGNLATGDHIYDHVTTRISGLTSNTGTITHSGTINADEFAVWKNTTSLAAASAAEVRTALNVANGATNVTNNSQISNGRGFTTNTGTTTASNTQTFTNKSGNISQWTNNSGYTTNTGTTTPSNSQTFTNKGGNISQWTNNSGYTTNTGTLTPSGTINADEFAVWKSGTALTAATAAEMRTALNVPNTTTVITNNNQLTNGAGYITDGNTNWNNSYGFVTTSGNTIIGTDSDISTSGATIINRLDMTDGVITAHGTRTLTLANLGYTGATNANNITNNNQLSNGAGYITSFTNTVDMGDGFIIEDGDGTEVRITENKEVKFVEGTGIDINWTDTSTGSDGDPYDLQITNTAPAGSTHLNSNTTKSDVGLSNVANESRATILGGNLTGKINNVAVADVTGGAALGKSANQDSTSTIRSGTTKANVGLSNVTNESKSTMFASAALTGNPTATTQAANNNSTRIATTAYVQTEISDLIGGAPGALDTLNELAAAIGDDASYASSITTALGGKLSTSGKAADSEKVDGINGASLLRSDADDSFSGGLVSTARDEGIFGIYDSTKTDHIWSMGTSYKNHASGTNFGNLYGLAYKHTITQQVVQWRVDT
jgi:hypothetical protein